MTSSSIPNSHKTLTFPNRPANRRVVGLLYGTRTSVLRANQANAGSGARCAGRAAAVHAAGDRATEALASVQVWTRRAFWAVPVLFLH